MNACLYEDAFCMGAHRVLRYDQLFSNVGNVTTASQKIEHFRFARRKTVAHLDNGARRQHSIRHGNNSPGCRIDASCRRARPPHAPAVWCNHGKRQDIHRHQSHHRQLRQAHASTRAYKQSYDRPYKRTCIHDTGKRTVHEYRRQSLVPRRARARYHHKRRRDRKHQKHERMSSLTIRPLKQRQNQEGSCRKRKQYMIQPHQRDPLVQKSPCGKQHDGRYQQPHHITDVRLVNRFSTRGRSDADQPYNERRKSYA